MNRRAAAGAAPWWRGRPHCWQNRLLGLGSGEDLRRQGQRLNRGERRVGINAPGGHGRNDLARLSSNPCHQGQGSLPLKG